MKNSNVIPFKSRAEVDLEQLPNPDSLSNEELGRLYEDVLEFENWCSKVKKIAFERNLEAGKNVFSGWKLILKRRATRAWAEKSIEKVKNILGDNFYEKKPVTPCGVERLLKNDTITEHHKDRLSQYVVHRGEHTYELVPNNHKRKSVFESQEEKVSFTKQQTKEDYEF